MNFSENPWSKSYNFIHRHILLIRLAYLFIALVDTDWRDTGRWRAQRPSVKPYSGKEHTHSLGS